MLNHSGFVGDAPPKKYHTPLSVKITRKNLKNLTDGYLFRGGARDGSRSHTEKNMNDPGIWL